MHGENVLISAAMAAGTSYAGGALGKSFGIKGDLGKAMLGDLVGTVANVGVEYTKQQTWGANKSNYEALTKPDAGRLGALAGTVGIAAIQNNIAMKEQAVLEAARKAAATGDTQKAIEILTAAGYAEDKRKQMAASMERQAFLEKSAGPDAALRLRAAFAEGGKLGAFGAQSMADGEAIFKIMDQEVRDLQASTGRPITNEEMMLLAERYNINPQALFSGSTNANMGMLANTNWGAVYQGLFGPKEPEIAGGSGGAPEPYRSNIVRREGFLGGVGYLLEKAGESLKLQSQKVRDYGEKFVEKYSGVRDANARWDRDMRNFQIEKDLVIQDVSDPANGHGAFVQWAVKSAYMGAESIYGTMGALMVHPADTLAGLMGALGGATGGAGQVVSGQVSGDQMLAGLESVAFKGLDAASGIASDVESAWNGDKQALSKLTTIAAAGTIFMLENGTGGLGGKFKGLSFAEKRVFVKSLHEQGLKGALAREALVTGRVPAKALGSQAAVVGDFSNVAADLRAAGVSEGQLSHFLKTGDFPIGYHPGDAPVRIPGEWSINDLKQGLLGKSPRGLGSPDIHHADQLVGSGVHEVLPGLHRNNPALHRNPFNQGVTEGIRKADRELHWWYRAREQGADQILPGWIYD